MTSFFLMNAWALFGMMAGAAAGFMLQEDAVGNTAAVFLALWVLDKPVELLARAGGFFPVLGAFAFFLGLYVISINVRARSDIVQRLLERLLPKPLVGPKVQ